MPILNKRGASSQGEPTTPKDKIVGFVSYSVAEDDEHLFSVLVGPLPQTRKRTLKLLQQKFTEDAGFTITVKVEGPIQEVSPKKFLELLNS